MPEETKLTNGAEGLIERRYTTLADALEKAKGNTDVVLYRFLDGRWGLWRRRDKSIPSETLMS